jgi:hypothetical protein
VVSGVENAAPEHPDPLPPYIEEWTCLEPPALLLRREEAEALPCKLDKSIGGRVNGERQRKNLVGGRLRSAQKFAKERGWGLYARSPLVNCFHVEATLLDSLT